ncbi:hypothetical protein ACQ4PT_061652 [Festuca glaucescens]
MAASDTQEGGVPAAGGAGLDDAPDPQRGLLAAGGQTASDHPPVVPGASDEEEGERGEEDASEAPQGLEDVGKQTASDHAPVAAQAAEYAEGTNGVVQAEQGVAPEPEEKLEVEDGGWEEDGDATEQDGEGEGEEDGEEDGEGDAVTPTDLPFAPTSKESIDFISTAIDVQEGIIQPLLKAGLVDHVVGLLKAEIERSLEGKLDRSCILSIILHFLEELSTIQGISEMMSSSDRLMEALVSMIKSPDNQLFDDTTAVDSVISLIHNIIPESSNLDKGFRMPIMMIANQRGVYQKAVKSKVFQKKGLSDMADSKECLGGMSILGIYASTKTWTLLRHISDRANSKPVSSVPLQKPPR